MNELLRRSSIGNVEQSQDVREPAADVVRADLDSSLKYFIVFFVLGVTSAIAFSYSIFLFASAPGLGTLLQAAGAGGVLFLLVVFQTLLIKSWQYNTVIAIAESLALVSFLSGGFIAWYGVAAAAFFVSWLIGFRRSRKDIAERLRFDIRHYSLHVISHLTLGFALFIAIAYSGLYLHTQTISQNAYGFVFDTAVVPTLRVIGAPISKEVSVDTALGSYIRNQLERQSDFGLLNQTQKDQVVKQVAFELRNKIIQVTGTPVISQETVFDYTYRLLATWIAGQSGTSMEGVIAVLLFAAVFFIVKALLFALKWLVLFLCTLLYYLLVSFKVVSVQTESRPKEVIIVK
jgi:hypothetical protein